MKDKRAVVLASSSSGLRASAWLARRGAAVRHLGLGSHQPDGSWPAWVLGRRSLLEAFLGDVFAPEPPREPWVSLLYRGTMRPVPKRRRDLVRLVGGSTLALVRDMRPHIRRPRTLGQWGIRTVGRRAWKQVLRGVLSKRLGLSCDDQSPSWAGLLVALEGAIWLELARSADEVLQTQLDAILEGGGEPLEDVEVHGVEVAAGRLVSVMTEFGRERVPGTLYCDLPPRQLLAWLPNHLVSASLRQAVSTLPVQARSVAAFKLLRTNGLPQELRVADVQVPVTAASRRGDVLHVELEYAPSDVEAVRLIRRVLGQHFPLGEVISVHRRIRPVPVAPEVLVPWFRLLDSLGVVPVGAAALHMPLDLTHEARWASLVASGLHAEDALGNLLGMPTHHFGLLA